MTPFLEDFENMKDMDGDGPFLITWTAAPQEQREVSAGRTEIYIAPVETRYLRPISQSLAAGQHRRWKRQRPVAEIAEEIQAEFVAAFLESADPRYVVVSEPTADSVTLRLSLVELDPTSTSGNVVRKVGSALAGPITGIAGVATPASGVAGMFTKGSIAIEGQLRDTAGGWLLLQFADREHDKMTLWTLRDFRPYGHAKVAIRDWARQFEELTRNPRWREMDDSTVWTLWPW